MAWTQALVSWLLFAGLSLSRGGIVSGRVAWRTASRSEDGAVRAPAQIGLALAMLASLLQLLLLAHDLSGETCCRLSARSAHRPSRSESATARTGYYPPSYVASRTG